MGDDLVATTYRNIESGQCCKITVKAKGVRGETIYFHFRLNIVLHNSYQLDKIVMEIEERKQKVPGDYV